MDRIIEHKGMSRRFKNNLWILAVIVLAIVLYQFIPDPSRQITVKNKHIIVTSVSESEGLKESGKDECKEFKMYGDTFSSQSYLEDVDVLDAFIPELEGVRVEYVDLRDYENVHFFNDIENVGHMIDLDTLFKDLGEKLRFSLSDTKSDIFYKGNEAFIDISIDTKGIFLKKGPWIQETGGHWVYVMGEDGRYAYKRNIKVGKKSDKFVEVVDGLEPGDKVIISTYKYYKRRDKLVIK